MALSRLALAVVPASVIIVTGTHLHANPGIEGVSYTDSANDIASGIDNVELMEKPVSLRRLIAPIGERLRLAAATAEENA